MWRCFEGFRVEGLGFRVWLGLDMCMHVQLSKLRSFLGGSYQSYHDMEPDI